MTTKKLPVSFRQHTGDRAIDQAQRLAQQAALAVNKIPAATTSPFTGGKLVASQTVTNAGTSIAHGLGKVPTGYVVTRVRSTTGSPLGAVVVKDNGTPDATNWPLITSFTSVTVDIVFF